MSTASKKVVIIESPFAGDIEKNLRYVRACLRDSILRGECPLASHALYTQPGVLRDDVPEERELGMGLGWHVMERADLVAVYTDLGWSSGMVRGYNAARDVHHPENIDIRRLGGEWSTFEPGVDYASIHNPCDYWSYRVLLDGVLLDRALEVDTMQGYAVAYRKDETYNVEVIKGKLSLERGAA